MQMQELLQTWLDDMGAAVLAGDWPGYAARVCLPFHLITDAASLVVATEQELRQGFDTFLTMLRAEQITDYIRLADSAVQINRRLISGRYTTHLMAGGNRVVPPFRSQITLRQEAGVWRAASISNALTNSSWPIVVPGILPAGTVPANRKDDPDD
jgi:hypothetical protein